MAQCRFPSSSSAAAAVHIISFSCSSHYFIQPQFTLFHSVFHSFHGLMNSINWPASCIWVFIAQLGEHCSATQRPRVRIPSVKPRKTFSGYFRNCLNCDSLRWSHSHFICIPPVHIISFEAYRLTRISEHIIFYRFP